MPNEISTELVSQSVAFNQLNNGWFQKISIPIPRAASRNSEGEGGGYVDWNSEDMGGFIELEFRRHGGIFKKVTSSLV